MITHIGRNGGMAVKTHVGISEQQFPATGEKVAVRMEPVREIAFHPIATISDAQGALWRITPGGIERVQ